ncbi:MAG: hypothetical protein GF344_11885 [Chitinivibrionales bacterium]|nr:hypothetical protein [Chitinivibrionales bacterium]MBD3357486.1 hypothetical protein [Chitinivibrionales bacterium]
MAKSPLELYQQAFKLHGQGQIQEAVILYKEIIKQFPDANESAYAAVQLEKVMADEVAESVGRRPNILRRLFALVVILLLLAIGGMQFYLYSRLERQVDNLETTVRSMAKMLQETRKQSSITRDRSRSNDLPQSRATDQAKTVPAVQNPESMKR